MRAGIFAFATDLLDGDVEVLLDRLAGVGITRILAAAAYHHGRDVSPMDARRALVYHEGGTVAFEPDKSRYGQICPEPATYAHQEPLRAAQAAAGTRGIELNWWLVLLHNSRLGARHPDATIETALGDRLRHALCPANADVRVFASALVADVVAKGARSITLEAVEFQNFDHGSHHERSFVPLDDLDRAALGLCFCVACRALGAEVGVDLDRIRATVTRHLRRRLGGDFPSRSRRADLESALAACAPIRLAAVLGFVDAVMRAGRKVPVTVLDPGGAILGYRDGSPPPDRRILDAGRPSGFGAPEVAKATGRLGVLGYVRDAERLRSELAIYRANVPDASLSVGLRAMAPDSRKPADVAAKVAVVQEAGIENVDFYHYGLMTPAALQGVGRALSSTINA